MTWNGNGTFDPPTGPEFPAIANDLIRAAYYNTVIQALCAGFSNTVPRDGQAPMMGNLNFAGAYSVIGLPAATVNGMAVRYNEFNLLVAQVAALNNTLEPFVLINSGII